jgi:hypothetical protein
VLLQLCLPDRAVVLVLDGKREVLMLVMSVRVVSDGECVCGRVRVTSEVLVHMWLGSVDIPALRRRLREWVEECWMHLLLHLGKALWVSSGLGERGEEAGGDG